MNMNFVPFLVLWALLAVSVLALFVWRKTVSSHEDDHLHVLGGASVAKSAEQTTVSQKLDFIDKWGKVLTVLTILYGVLIAGIYVWLSWVQNSKLGV
jgi:uncharacterized membrane protein